MWQTNLVHDAPGAAACGQRSSPPGSSRSGSMYVSERFDARHRVHFTARCSQGCTPSLSLQNRPWAADTRTMDVTDPQFLLWASAYVLVKWTLGLWTVRRIAVWLRTRSRPQPTSR